MSQPTTAELALLRTRPHRSHLYLSIYQPPTVFAAQINDTAIAPGENIITYDGVSAGAYTDVEEGMTMYVGSSPGGSNYGRIRVRVATSSSITVAENSDINWKDNLYLTIKDYHEVWPKFQTLQQIGTNPGDLDILVYKDTDIVYADQNLSPGALIWMGEHRAANLENGSALLYWSATGTYSVSGESLGYNWTFEGGTATGTAGITPGMVSYATPGHYKTTLQVTNSSGTVDTSYRYVSIYDETHPPIQKWGMADLKGSRAEGGYTSTIWIKEPISSIVEGSLVVIFADNQYGATHQSINGNIVFVGYILDDTISYDFQTSTVEFDVGSVTEVMKLCSGPGISLTSNLTPNSWSKMKDIDISKAIWFYLRWHSTVLNVADVMYIGPNYLIYSFETDAGTLYDVLNDFMSNTLFGSSIANRKGQIVCQIDPEGQDNAPQLLPLGMGIDRHDWINTPSIQERTRTEISYLEAGGFYYNSSSGTENIPYLAAAPGMVPSYFGKSAEHQGLALLNQAHLNTLVGNVFNYRNTRYGEISIDFQGNYNNLELAPIEKYLLTIVPTDSQSRINVVNLPLHINELNWRYAPEIEYLAVSGNFHELTTGTAGEYLPIPQEPIYNFPNIPTSTGTIPVFPGFIPWNPPLIPNDPPQTGYACREDLFAPENGPYYIYPATPSLDINNPSTDAWFPCIVRRGTASHPTRINIDYRSSDKPYAGQSYSNGGIESVSLIRQDKSVIETVPIHFGEAIFTNPAWREVAGFRFTLGQQGLGFPDLFVTSAGSECITYAGQAQWYTTGKAMGFIEAQGHLSDWPYIQPWGVGWRLALTGSYPNISAGRIKVKKIFGSAECLVFIPGTQYATYTSGSELYQGGYNIHAGGYPITNPGDIVYRTDSHAVMTVSGDLYFGIGTYWDDAFSPASHPSRYELLAVELQPFGGDWFQIWGSNVVLPSRTVFIRGITLRNICTIN